MKKIVTLLFLLISLITYSQSGVGYLNYTSYLTHNGNGSTTQYPAFANSATDFNNMFNTANSNTTIYSQGVGSAAHTLVVDGSYAGGLVRNDYWGVKVTGYFIPKETGLYYFGINADDGADLLINGTVVTSYYGGHGMGGYQTGGIQMTAGQIYTFMARFQQYGGGWGMMVAWRRPSQSSLGLQPDEVYSSVSNPSKKVKMNFDFGGTLDKTKFSIGSNNVNSIVDVTSLIDSTKIGNGSKGTIVAGQVEWSVMNIWNGVTYVFIDARKLNGTQPTDINQVKILDLYDGPVTFYSYDGTWAVYSLPTSVPKLTDGTSTYNSLIRPFNGMYYGLSCDITFAANQKYKPQSVTITTTNTLSTLYNSIVTVSDVYLAFKELADGGLFGNQTGNQFTYGIQYKNADVNDDGYFNEADCFALLQHLTGKKTLVDTFNLRKTLKLIPQSTYANIGKSDWSTFPSFLGDTYTFDINTGNATDTLNMVGTWKGDVNLSHSGTPPSNGITTMAIRSMSISNEIDLIYDTELVGDSVVVTIKLNPLQQQVAAVQFDLNFDKLLTYSATNFGNQSTTNFAKLGSNVVTIGSLNTSGQPLGNTSYKISFKGNTTNILGLISISNYEGMNVSGNVLKVKVL